ncbi:MAG: aryl-sulfate sulfotransferase [Myxococcota bacterium]
MSFDRIVRGALGLTLVACGSEIQVQDVASTVTPSMGTVVEVTWTTDVPTTGFVRFGEGETLDRETAPSPEPSTTHTAQLVALPQQTDINFVVVAGEGDDAVESDVQTVTTGALDGFVPEITVTGDPVDHFMVVPLLSKRDRNLAYPVVIDREGRVVWTFTDTREAQVYRAQLSRDGSGVVYSATVVGGGPVQDSAIVRVGWDGEILVTHDIPWLAHDFIELEDGRLVTLASECRDEDGNPVALQDGGCPDAIEGNTLLAISPDGSVETLWATWDCLDPKTHPSNAFDRDNWTHTNALDYDEATDTYLVGMRNLDSILSVDVETKTCDWGLGGIAGTLDVAGARFRKQHQYDWVGDRLLVFDNQGGFPNSRVVEYRFDTTDGATEVRTFVSDPPVFTLVLGDVYRTSNGNTRIFWGNPDTVDNTALSELYDADGVMTSQIRVAGMIMGFSQIVVDPGRPDLGEP